MFHNFDIMEQVVCFVCIFSIFKIAGKKSLNRLIGEKGVFTSRHFLWWNKHYLSSFLDCNATFAGGESGRETYPSCAMTDNKDPEPKVEFNDTKSLDAKISSRKTKIAVIGGLALVLLLGAVASVTSLFVLRNSSPPRLAEVNLEADETLTYRVDHEIEIQKGNVQKSKSNYDFYT